MATRVAVVTGSNKGIGFGIVRGLCKQFKGDVFLTARDTGRGQAAIVVLKKEGLNPKFHQLDITDHSSIETLKQYLLDNYGGLDVLVNNAGIAYKMVDATPFAEQAEVTLSTNFWGTLDCCRVLFPILKPHARVVNISSMACVLMLDRCSEEKKKLIHSVKSIEDVENIMRQFVEATKDGTHQEKGFPNMASPFGKVGTTAVTILQQKEFDSDPREDIIVNAICPGHVSTDMSSHKGKLTIDEGAEGPVRLALLPPGTTSPKGNFVYKNNVIVPWNETTSMKIIDMSYYT